MSSAAAQPSTGDRILDAALDILEEGGTAALTTRAVCDAAGVTAPTLYHHFHDKEGLVRALLGRETARFVAVKRATAESGDPVADLMRGWDQWVEMALRRPRLVALYRQHAAEFPQAAADSHLLILARVERVARAGRLRGEPVTVAHALMAASSGVVDLVLSGVDRTRVRQVNTLVKAAMYAAVVVPPEG